MTDSNLTDFKLTLENITETSFQLNNGDGVCLGVLYLHVTDQVYRFKPTACIDLGFDEINLIRTKINQLNHMVLNPKGPYEC